MAGNQTISGVMVRRRQVRFLTVLSCVILVAFAFQLMVSNGAKKASAATIHGGTLASPSSISASYGADTDLILDSGYFDASKVTVWDNTDTTPGSVHTAGAACSAATAAVNGHCNTKRTFKSLTLQNGAVLTHAAVTVDDMRQAIGGRSGSLASVATGSARLKKVEIIVNGLLKIDGTSSIDVTGRGYPGGASFGCPTVTSEIYTDPFKTYFDGFGPGNGIGGWSLQNTDWGFGGGGGYGGNGQNGSYRDVSSIAGGHFYGSDNPKDTYFEFGSGGGGYAVGGCARIGAGGSGGGRISIVTNSIEIASGGKILANGAVGKNENSDNKTRGGSGSGGTVFIQFTATEINTNLNATVSALPTAQDGSFRLVGVNTSASAQISISANGGERLVDNAAGGGGRVYIEKLVSSGGISIKKWLTPVSRNGTPDQKFNPYDLQKGDTVLVHIFLGNYTGSTTLKDDFLSGSGAKCAFVSSGTDGYSKTSTSISWNGLDAATYANGQNEINYTCNVQ